MEEVAFSLARALWHFIQWIFIQIIVEVVFYGIGYGTLKILTFGKYPKSYKDSYMPCVATGIISLAVTFGIIAFFSIR